MSRYAPVRGRIHLYYIYYIGRHNASGADEPLPPANPLGAHLYTSSEKEQNALDHSAFACSWVLRPFLELASQAQAETKAPRERNDT